MGTFERIRQVSPYFFVVFAVLLVAYFVWTSGAEDVMKGAGYDPKTAKIGYVNGEPIYYSEYEKTVRDVIEQQRRSKKTKEEDIDESQIRSQVWEEMVDEILARQEAEKVGIMVTDDEIRDVFVENPPEALKRMFSDSTGNEFNKQLYLEVIANPDKLKAYLGKMPPEQQEQTIAEFRSNINILTRYIRQQKYVEGLMGAVNNTGSIVSQTFAKMSFLSENATANVNYIALETKDIPNEQIKITDEEIKAYYEKYKQYYKQKPQRKLKYVSMPIVPSKEDTIKAGRIIDRINLELQPLTTIEERDKKFDLLLNEYYGTTSDYILVKDLGADLASFLLPMQERQVIGPMPISGKGTCFLRLDGRRKGESEVVKASHILIKFGDNKDSAKTEAMKILKEAKSGSNFEELARKYSTDKGSAVKGGDLGYFAKGSMVKEFEEAAFAAAPGEIVGPVESQFGYHIIKVEDKKSEEIKYSEIEVKPKVSTITKNIIKREAISIKLQVEEGQTIDTIAHRLKKGCSETALFEKNRPVLGSQYITDKAFESEVGTVFDPQDLKNYGLVVIQVSDTREKGIKPLEDVKPEIIRKLQIIKKLDMLKSKAQDIYQKISAQGKLESISSFYPQYFVKSAPELKDNGVVPGIGQDIVLTTTAYKIPIGQISKPVRGERGYYIMQVLNRTLPDVNTIRAAMTDKIKEIQKITESRLFNQWYSKMKEDADIQDLRSKFFSDY